MEVQTRSALIITLAVSSAAVASEFHDSLQAGVICSSDVNPIKFEITESPAPDGFFNISTGLCKAVTLDPDEQSTLFTVGHCLLESGEQFSFMFGGWLNMLSVRFDEKSEEDDLYCR